MSEEPDADAIAFETALNEERPTRISLILLALLAALFTGLAVAAPERPFFQSGMSLIWVSVLLAAALLWASYIDIKIFILPDILTLPLIPAGILVHFAYTGLWIDSLAGAALGGGLFLSLYLGWRHFLKREGLGLGDVKLIMAGGAFCTAWAIPTILICAAASALIVVLLASIRRGGGAIRTVPVPFGPFLALGIWTAWWYPGLYLY